MTTLRRLACVHALILATFACQPSERLPVVAANDNRTPAGELSNDTLSLRMSVRMARWYPEAEDGPFADVAAFALEGEDPSIPAPLIRVRTGTVIDVTVRNELTDSTISVHGLVTRPAASDDSVSIAPGESHRFVFEAGEPGTYLYFARPGVVDYEVREREQIAGAFVVDPESGPTDDRIFVMNIWGEPVFEADSAGAEEITEYRNALAINGRSFPYTERIAATVGEPVRWRVVNASIRGHPMHLHGFYFDVESYGDAWSDTTYMPEQRRKVVTEDMNGFETMTLSWTPDRDGNWLFHCHIGFHMSPETARLEAPDEDHAHALSGDVGQHMAGLVLGIEVSYPPGMSAPPRGEPRRLRVFAQQGKPRGKAERAMGYVLQRDDAEPAPDSVEIAGSPLILTRGEPTDIVVVNRLPEPTGLHWHGLELESWSDGVVGWSGNDQRVAPPIVPGDSFVARLTLPRAGTFIYHTHLNDLEQLSAGLYGPLIVVEPDEPFDPATDHILIAGWDGLDDSAGPPVLVNDAFEPPEPLRVAAGVRQRFRFLNMGPAARITYSILQDSVPVQWQAWAKDGADLPAHQRTTGLARLRINVGETADIMFTPEAGEYELVVEHPFAAPRAYVRKIIAR